MISLCLLTLLAQSIWFFHKTLFCETNILACHCIAVVGWVKKIENGMSRVTVQKTHKPLNCRFDYVIRFDIFVAESFITRYKYDNRLTGCLAAL